MAIDIPEQRVKRALFYARGNKVVLQGEIDQNEPDLYLNPFFKKVIEQMDDSVVLDITRLDFLNSAAVSCLLEFLMNRKPHTRVLIKIDKTKNWQRYSIYILQSLDTENISLVE